MWWIQILPFLSSLALHYGRLSFWCKTFGVRCPGWVMHRVTWDAWSLRKRYQRLSVLSPVRAKEKQSCMQDQFCFYTADVGSVLKVNSDTENIEMIHFLYNGQWMDLDFYECWGKLSKGFWLFPFCKLNKIKNTLKKPPKQKMLKKKIVFEQISSDCGVCLFSVKWTLAFSFKTKTWSKLENYPLFKLYMLF